MRRFLVTPVIDSAVVFHRRFVGELMFIMTCLVWLGANIYPPHDDVGGRVLALLLTAVGLVFFWCLGVRPEVWVTETAVLVRNPYRSYRIEFDDIERVYQGVWGVATIKWSRRRMPIRVFAVQTTNWRQMLRRRSCVDDFIDTLQRVTAR